MSESKTPESKANVPETKTNGSSKAGLDKEKLATAVRVSILLRDIYNTTNYSSHFNLLGLLDMSSHY